MISCDSEDLDDETNNFSDLESVDLEDSDPTEDETYTAEASSIYYNRGAWQTCGSPADE